LFERKPTHVNHVTAKERKVAEDETMLAASRAELEKSSALSELKNLEQRLSFSPKLPTSVLLSWRNVNRYGATASPKADRGRR